MIPSKIAPFLLLLFSFLSWQTPLRAQETKITWAENFPVALETARKENKRLFALFGCDCDDCRKFDSELRSNQELRALLGAGFIAVKVDMGAANEETMKAHEELAKKYDLTPPCPVVLICDGEGKAIGAPLTFKESETTKFLESLKERLAQKEPRQEPEKAGETPGEFPTSNSR